MGIWASFVTYLRLALNFPREVGEMAKKWPQNDPLVVGGEEEPKLIRQDPTTLSVGEEQRSRPFARRLLAIAEALEQGSRIDRGVLALEELRRGALT